VQLAPPAKVLLQTEMLELEKSPFPLRTTELMTIGAVPVLVRVTFWTELLVPV
jgi:hypothetical protein